MKGPAVGDAIAWALAEAGLPSDKHRDTPRQAGMRLRIRYNAPLDLVHVERWRQLTSGGIYYNQAAGAAIAASMPVWGTCVLRSMRILCRSTRN